MYDPSELAHDTHMRHRALTAGHLSPPAAAGLTRGASGARTPVILLTAIVGLFTGGWLV